MLSIAAAAGEPGASRTIAQALEFGPEPPMSKKPVPPARPPAGRPARPAGRPQDELYGHHDPIPAPEAEERSSDTAWALFQELRDTDDRMFAPTAPMSSRSLSFATTQPAPAPGAALRTGRGAASGAEARIDDLLLEARRNNRVCPQPPAWDALYALLPDRRQGAQGWEPPLPVTGPAWQATGAMSKRLVLRDQLEWAAARGAAAAVLAHLRGLAETDWLHVGEPGG